MFQAFNNSVRIVIGLLMLGWFGYLFWHFGGMAQNGMEKELGPTVLGIGALLLLILLPLVFRMIRGATKLASSEPERILSPDEAGGFDADAAIQRYMAEKRNAAPAAPHADAGASMPSPGPARPAGGFGRKGA